MAARQEDTLRMFTALRLWRPSWGGSLLVGLGLNDAGRALALASLTAGAASIFPEDDAVYVRAAQREGCCTFTVSSLDEALRIVKNEVRQRHAITVALRGNPAAWLHDMVERGVQPQAFATTRVLCEGESSAVDALCGRGMQTACGFGLRPIGDNSIDLEDVLSHAARGGWSLHEQAASTAVERRTQDGTLLDAPTQEDAMGRLARQWLQVAPALFPRALERVYWRHDSRTAIKW